MSLHYWSLLLVYCYSCIFHTALCQSSSSCPPCDCRSITNCGSIHRDLEIAVDECNCCSSCGLVGDECGEGRAECLSGLLCLPNDPYSPDYHGTCYELTDCLSFGCTDAGGECKCLYSSSCPLRRFPYYTLEECQVALMQAKCQDIDCPPQLTAQDCTEGMYFEQGPSYYSECCPVSGSCVCNVSMCPVPLECGPHSELVMIEGPPGENSCCDQYECRPIPGCFHDNKHYELNDKWRESSCRECHCTTDGVYCMYTNCSQLEDCEVTYVPDDGCCPECLEPATPATVPSDTPIFSDPESGCYSEVDGVMLEEGDVVWPGPCRMCRCTEGRIVCEEKTCEPLVCGDDQVYGEMEGKCCPQCIDKITDTTMERKRNQTIESETVPVSSPTPSTNESTGTPTGTPTGTNAIELVMVLDAEMKVINENLEDFSTKLTSMLESHSLKPMSIDVKEDMGETVLIVSIADTEQVITDMQQSNVMLSESDVALMVSRTAQKYSFVTRADTGTDDHHTHHSSASALGMAETEFNATVIVLTTIAAVGLISFIGVFIGLVLVTRRLKTIKAIKGQHHKRSTTTLRP